MTSIADGILPTVVFVLLDKAAQTGVESSLKQGVMQAVDRELCAPQAPGVSESRDPHEIITNNHALSDLHGLPTVCTLGRGYIRGQFTLSWVRPVSYLLSTKCSFSSNLHLPCFRFLLRTWSRSRDWDRS
jgi:hypothetical protein